MSYQAGEAFVSIKPDMSAFQDKVKAELAATDAQFGEAGDKAGASFGTAFQAQLKEQLASLPDAVIKADIDDTAAKAELDDAAKTRTATVKVNVDKSSLAQAKSALSDLGKNTGELGGNLGTVGLAGSALALAPDVLGAGLGAVGIGVGLAAAAADAGAFGAIAIPMFTAVSAAQTKLATAQAAYNKATTDKGRATALAAEKAALDGLTPSEQQLAVQLTGLTTAWKQLSDAQQPAVGAAIAPWLSTATSGMKLLNPLITGAANAIELLGNEADVAVQSPFWTTFSNVLGQAGEVAIQDLGTAAGSFADGLAHLFVTFAPDIQSLLDDIPKLAGDFDQWSKSVTSSGVDKFFSTTFSHANLQALKGDLTDVGKFFSTVSSATQSMSPLAFSGFTVLLEAIGELPPDAVIALTALFLATKTIGAIGNIAGLAGNVISLGKTAAGVIGGLFGGTATTAAAEADGTAAGTAGGTSAATAFTSTFSAEVTAALPAAFTEIGASGSTESATAGTAMGTTAAAAFGTSFAAEDALGVTAAVTAAGTEAGVEAGVAGAAIGTALAGGFAESLAGIGTALAAALPEAGGLALLGVAVAGVGLGAAFGGGVVGGFALSGAKNVASGLEGDLKSATASAGTWLQPAGQQAADGFGTGFASEQSKVESDVGQLKAWTQAGASGSGTWIAPHGQQAATGFGTGFASEHAVINSGAAQLKSWVTAALPNPAAWLVNEGVSVMQGFLNGLVSEYGAVQSFVSGIAGWIAAHKGPVSDDYQLLQPAGRAIMSGFGDALQAEFAGSVQPFVGGIAGALAGSVHAQSMASLAALGVPSVSAGALLPGVSSPLSGGPLQLQVSYTGTGNEVTDALVSGLQFHIVHATGGDVQAALGQGSVRTGLPAPVPPSAPEPQATRHLEACATRRARIRATCRLRPKATAHHGGTRRVRRRRERRVAPRRTCATGAAGAAGAAGAVRAGDIQAALGQGSVRDLGKEEMATITIDTSHEGCEFDGHPDGEQMPGVIPVHREARSACCSAVLAEGGSDEAGYACTACGKPATKVMGDRKAHWTCRCGQRRSQVITQVVDEPAEG